MSNAKVHKPQNGDQLVVESGGSIQVKTGGKMLPNSGTQAVHIADGTAITGGEAPTEAEHNALMTKVNGILAALRGVGILASS
jgi:hypothetical protein